MRSFIRLHGSSRAIAAGFALGLFIGWTPTVGIQMILAGVAATLVRVNRIAAIAGVWITNLVTAVPMYSLAWRLGAYVLVALGMAHPAEVPKSLRAVLTYAEGEPFWRQTWEKLGALLQVGGELWVGGLILGALSGLVGYLVVVRLVEGQRLLSAKRRARRWRKKAGAGTDRMSG